MEHATKIGLDLAKNVLQVHGIDAAGKVVLRRKLRRAAVLEFFAALQPALVGMEACGGAHYWRASSLASGTRCGSCLPLT
jgi:transposase